MSYYSYDISAIDGMNGHDFEYFCAEVLSLNGFYDVSVTPGSGDQGVDIIAYKDEIKYAFQCKNYASPLSNKPIQEVSAGKLFYGCSIGVVLTNSTFTPGAIQLAEATNVLLWGRDKLTELIVNSGSLDALGIADDFDDNSTFSTRAPSHTQMRMLKTLLPLLLILLIGVIVVGTNRSGTTAPSVPSESVDVTPAVFTPHSALEINKFEGSLDLYSEVKFVDAKASSTLIQDSVVFSAGYAIDENSNRAWVEGVYGNGIGETITLHFDGEETIDVLALDLGYARSSEFYYLNNRPSSLRFTFSDGSEAEYTFEDILRQNVVGFSESVTTSYVKITILDVYTGTEDDTCIYLVKAYRK